MTTKKYFQLARSADGATVDLDIYGDIASRWWDDSATDASKLSQMLEELGDVGQINVHINSYGGEVSEGLAIYSALRRHSAKVRTTCDGFACSIASVIFMAGDERVMSDASLLMIHNAWTSTYGANAAELRKLADDMDTITQASKNAYMSRVSIDEEALADLMDAETWILPQDAVEMGFATEIEHFDGAEQPSQSARSALMGIVREHFAEQHADDALDGSASETAENGEENAEIAEEQAETADSADEAANEPQESDAAAKPFGAAAMAAFCSAIAGE